MDPAGHPEDASAHFPSNNSTGALENADPPTSLEHLELCAEIEKRGAVLGLIDNSYGTDEKILKLAEVVHAEPERVLVFFLSENNVGKFRRQVITDYAGENGGK